MDRLGTPVESDSSGLESTTSTDTDVLVIGAGPAGASAAIRLSNLGWRVTLAERAAFPRQKVCGECLSPASLQLLDELELVTPVTARAGPPIRQIAWMAGNRVVVAAMPACRDGTHAFGCAIGRDTLDAALLEHARFRGVAILQPATVHGITGTPGEFECAIERRCAGISGPRSERHRQRVTARLVIDARGSWDQGPDLGQQAHAGQAPIQHRPADLLAFKTSFENAGLADGVLPIVCFPGGYAGMIVSDRKRTTVACCIRREALQRWRRSARAASAGEAVEELLRNSSAGAAAMLRAAQRHGAWQAIGPLRPGFHPRSAPGIVRIGNAAAEVHPLAGEGMCMALQSAAILAQLCAARPKAMQLDASSIGEIQRAHAAACRQAFSTRLRFAEAYARIAMQPLLASAAAIMMQNWPRVLSAGALFVGKARPAGFASSRHQEPA